MKTQNLFRQISSFSIVLFLIIGCSSSPATPTAIPPTATSTAIPPTATTAPTSTPLPTATLIPTPTLLPTEVIVRVSSEAMDVISSWDDGILAFTPANNPVANLEGLTSTDVGIWNNSRIIRFDDLYNEVVRLLSADLGTQWEEGLYACPNVDEAFSTCSLRIYFTDDSVTEIDGALRVIFQPNP